VILSLDATTDAVLERIARLGILGQSKAEAGTTILRYWIWENQDKLAQQGLRIAGKNKKGPR
jgi:hypothetical protein